MPPGEVISGQSALVNVAAPPDDPQIGASPNRGAAWSSSKTPVALHVAFPERPRGDGYPESLMGVIAFVRQAFLDAQHYQAADRSNQRVKPATRGRSSTPRSTRCSRRSTARCRSRSRPTGAGDSARAEDGEELKLDPIVTGAPRGDQVVGGSEGAERARDPTA